MTDARTEERLARLEAENRRLKRIGLAGLGAFCALGLASWAAPTFCHTVTAERFVLRDAHNKKRLTMNAYGTDVPTIAFHDAKGKQTGTIGVTKDGSLKIATTEKGESVPARFSVDDDGAIKIKVLTGKERLR